MNRDLISKLYQEAVEYCTEQDPNSDGYNIAWLWEEKFVELIVNECLIIVENSRIEGDGGVCLVGATKCKIKHHFGVE